MPFLAVNGQIPSPKEKDSLAVSQRANQAFGLADSLLKRKDPVGAMLAFREAISLYNQLYEPNDPGLSKIYRTAAEFFATHDQLSQAASYLQEGLKILNAQPRPDYGEIGQFNLYLGKIYKDESYHLSAINYYKDAIYAYEQDNYETHFEQFVISKILIGKAYYEMGDYKKAIAYFSEVKGYLKKYSSPISNDMATMYNNIGAAYLGLNVSDSALYNIQKSVDISELVNGVNSQYTAERYGMMSVAYFNGGQYDSSFVYAEKVMEVYRGLPGNFLKEISDYQFYLGRRFIDLRAYSTAEIWFDKFLTTKEQIETDSMNVRPDTLIAYDYTDQYRKIADLFAKNYQFAFSLKYLDRGFDFMKNRSEPAADSLSKVIARQAKELSIKMANWEKAESYALLLVDASKNASHNVSTDSLRQLYEELGTIRMNAQAYKGAIAAYRSAIAYIPSFNNKMSAIYNQMGQGYYMLNEYDSAKRVLEVSVNFYRQVYGGNHLLLPDACLTLGIVYYYQNEPEKSFNTLKVVTQKNPSLLEQANKLAVEGNRILANIHRKKGQLEQAEQYLARADRLAKKVYKSWQMND